TGLWWHAPTHAPWPRQRELEHSTKGRFALNAQAVQQIVHAFLANVETTRTLRREHPEMRMKYPWREKRFYPVKWPAQAVHREKGRVVLPMGKGHPSLVLPIALPENAGACTLVWNRGFELHVCLEVPQASEAPGSVQATVDLGEIHLAAVTTNTGKALIVTGRGIRSLKRQRSRQLGQLAKKQSRCQKHSRRWKNGNTARTLTTSRTKANRLASCARPAPNEEPAAGVPDASTRTSPGRETGSAARAADASIAIWWARSKCIRMRTASI